MIEGDRIWLVFRYPTDSSPRVTDMAEVASTWAAFGHRLKGPYELVEAHELADDRIARNAALNAYYEYASPAISCYTDPAEHVNFIIDAYLEAQNA